MTNQTLLIQFGRASNHDKQEKLQSSEGLIPTKASFTSILSNSCLSFATSNHGNYVTINHYIEQTGTQLTNPRQPMTHVSTKL